MPTLFCGGRPMPNLTAEVQAALDKLTTMNLELDLRGDDGKTLLRVVPTDPTPAEDFWGPDLTEEEIQRIIAAPGAMTLDEFWKKMGVR